MRKFLFAAGLLFSAFAFSQGVGFNLNPTNGCRPLKVKGYVYYSPAGSNYYVWYFGNGDSAISRTDSVMYTYKQTGNFQVQVNAYDTVIGGPTQFLGSSNYYFDVSVSGDGMNVSADTTCLADVVTAYIYPDGNNSNYWDFGDGTNYTGQNASHTYSSTGKYIISCAYYNAQCSTNDTITRQIVIQTTAKPSAHFSFSNNTVCPNDMLTFYPQNQNATSYFWTFGDGGTSSQGYPSYSYSALGHYPVTLTITSPCGTNSYTDTAFVVGNQYFPTYISINGSAKACPGAQTQFSLNYNTTPVSQVWKFGDGDTSIANNPQHAYTLEGKYYITAKIYNGCGNDTTLKDSIIIGKTGWDPNSNIGINLNPTSLCPGDAMNYSVYSSPTAKSYNWDFGDGATSPVANGQHAYAVTNTYTVSVTLTNNCGVDTLVTSTNPVLVSNGIDPVVAHNGNNNNWGALVDSACVGDSVIFYAMGGAHYLYEFGDGTSSANTYVYTIPGQGTADLIKHAYLTPGTYKVILTLFNLCGNSAKDSLYIVVGTNQPVRGAIISTGGNNSVYPACSPLGFIGSGGNYFLWRFGDGDTLETTQAAITHSYGAGGTYHYSLKVTNACGHSAIYTDSLVVQGMSISTSVTNVSCNGGSNGSFSVSVLNGTPPYLYSYNGGTFTGTDSAFGLSAVYSGAGSGTTYMITVRDANGCTMNSSVIIAEPAPMVISPSVNAPTCNTKNGSVSLTVSGDTPGYSYKWSNGANASTATPLSSGTYSVTVTDSKGCTGTTSVILNSSSGPNVVINSIVNLSCSYSTTCVASAFASASGGTGTLTYKWSSGSSIAAGSGLCLGSNFVTVTDANHCQNISDVVITKPAPIVATVTKKDVSCSGTLSGIASVAVSGGTGVATYSWSTGSSSATITGLAANIYSLTVTDAHACFATQTVAILGAVKPDSIPICMVTVDSLSHHNQVIWQQPSSKNVDSIIVFREITTNVYKQIGALSGKALSIFTDTVQKKYFPNTGNPNSGTYRYKIQVRDTCGNYSGLSPYHNTIYTTQNGGTFTWNQYTIEGDVTPVPTLSSYVLLRDDIGNNVWHAVNSVAGSQTVLADPSFSSFPNGNWKVETIWGISCTPTLRLDQSTTVNSSRSNIKNNLNVSTGIQSVGGGLKLNVYPNPAQDLLNIAVSGGSSVCTVELISMLGQKVTQLQINGSSAILNLSTVAAGVYYLRVYDVKNSSGSVQKVVVTK